MIIKYKQLPFHFKIPHGMFVHEVSGIAIDRNDNVFCLSRGNIPMIVFDKNGNYLFSWGNKIPFSGFSSYTSKFGDNILWKGNDFVNPHGIFIDDEEYIWIVDRDAHTVSKFTKDGTRLLMIIPDKKHKIKVIKNKKEI